MSIRFDFSNKSAVVTGGARGIGLELTRQLLASGANVSVWEYAEDSIQSAMHVLASFGSHAHFQRVDVASLQSCEEAASALPFEIDILINNAGITRDKSFAKMSGEDFEQVVATNLNGVFNVTKSLLPKFKSVSLNKRIINISSTVAHNGNFGQTNYVASKAGVIGLSKTLSRELARKGFTVNAVAPGFIQTAMVEAMPAEARTGMAEKIPVGRLGQPRDVAHACLFLASEEASFISGAVVNVDGGLVV